MLLTITEIPCGVRMIKAVNLTQQGINFRSESETKKTENETRILANNHKTRVKQGFQKTTSAFLDYPVKGLKGDINSNFYEFLTMGIIPYLAGSAMFMAMFNCVNNYLLPDDKKIASIKGKKLALGVVLYGILKGLSKKMVSTPVKLATGVDVEMPYENIVYPLPKQAGENANIEVQHQQRKVFDSKEFYRKDLLNKDYFAKVAKKLGLGEDLKDPVGEASPIIQNIVATSNTAKSLSSYCWAGLGVALAFQDSWTEFFDSISQRSKYVSKKDEGFISVLGNKLSNIGKNAVNITKSFINSFGKGCKSLWIGNAGDTGYMKHAGKAFVMFTAALTAFLTANTIVRAKNMAKNNNIKTIDKSKESMVI